jgi:hypothetical protein
MEYTQLVRGLDKAKWIHSCPNELGHLPNGVGTARNIFSITTKPGV